MIVEVIVASLTTIVVSSLIFAKKVVDDERTEAIRVEQQQRLDEEREAEKKRLSEEFKGLPVITSVKDVQTCPYCKSTNEKATILPSGGFLLSNRNNMAQLRKHQWGPKTVPGPSTGIAVQADGQRLWQMCIICWAQWLCAKPTISAPKLDHE